VSKHGVLGLFRSFLSTAFFNGTRVNMLCPYYMDTPLLPTEARFMLGGSAMGKPEVVVDAGTCLMADSRIVRRALVVGPKVETRLSDEGMLIPLHGTFGNCGLSLKPAAGRMDHSIFRRSMCWKFRDL
jgi:NAD(P)-dependent dehydrogenase (short-subunit alcohol dehydrogenase family)